MTAFPSDPDTLLLVCDNCGRAFTPDGPRPAEWITLWTLATGAGWHGRDRAIGPHTCERCPGAVTGRGSGATRPAAPRGESLPDSGTGRGRST